MELLKSSPNSLPTDTAASKSGSKLDEDGIETASNPLCSTDSKFMRDPRSMEDADKYLEDFRTKKLEYFAFLPIHPDTSSEKLRQERPFLWLCIMAISCPSISDQIRLGNGIRQIVSQKVVINGERNLDLLLGIMIFVGWAQYQCHGGPLLTVFTQLALSLLYDLELHKSVVNDSQLASGWGALYSKFAITTTRTMEHRRAALGCFLLNSITVPSHRKRDRLHWTPYLEECLQNLEEKREYPTDERFAHQIRLQLIADKALPYPVHNELLEAKSKIPPHLISDMTLVTQIEVMLDDIVLSNAIVVCPDVGSFRVEYLSACLNSLKTWFDLFFQYPPSVYTRFSWCTFGQLKYCVFVLGRLSSLEYPAWDTRFVRDTLDISCVLQQLAKNLRQVKNLAGLKTDTLVEDVFTKIYKQVVSLQCWWESKVEFGSIVTNGIAPHHQVPATADCLSDYWDNSWSHDLLGSWEA
ncbi:hypothetical protein V1509DRAFT_641574 [Lipomyces kononenkoae]